MKSNCFSAAVTQVLVNRTTKALATAITLGVLSACNVFMPEQTALNNNHKSSQYTVEINDDRIQVMGRTVKQDSGLALGYPGSGILFKSDASSISITASSSNDNTLVDVIINNTLASTIVLSKTSSDIVIAENLTGTNTFHLINRAESWHGIPAIKSVHTTGGQLLTPNALPNKKLLVIGDSITCGAMSLRAEVCKKDPEFTSPYHSYGMRLARELDTQVHLVCFSGRGLIRSWDGKTDEQQAPDYLNYSIPVLQEAALWQHKNYQPDAVIVALGTNDFNPGIPDKALYVGEYKNFVDTLTTLYPDAQIGVTVGAMLGDWQPDEPKRSTLASYLTHVQQHAPDKVTILPSSYQPGDECDPHPTAAQHEKMAEELVEPIRALLSQ